MGTRCLWRSRRISCGVESVDLRGYLLRRGRPSNHELSDLRSWAAICMDRNQPAGIVRREYSDYSYAHAGNPPGSTNRKMAHQPGKHPDDSDHRRSACTSLLPPCARNSSALSSFGVHYAYAEFV